jgi:hypothetical protein
MGLIGGVVFYGLIIGVAILVFNLTKTNHMENPTIPVPGGFTQPVPPAPRQFIPVPPRPKSKYSVLSILLAVIFGIIVIMFGERLIFDLNRFINPAIDKEYTKKANELYQGGRRYQYESPNTVMDSSSMMKKSLGSDSMQGVTQEKVYFSANEEGRYLMYKAIIYAAIIIPLFIFAFVIFYLKKSNPQFKPLLMSFIISAFWLMFHLLGIVVRFVLEAYKNFAIYIILFFLLATFGFLTYYTQQKHTKEIKE